jgi:hypothetical protein
MNGTGRLTKPGLGLLAGLVLIAIIAGTAWAASFTTAPISRFTGVDEMVEACKTGTTYSTMPQMTRTFTLGGSVNDEAVVMFEGSLSLDASTGGFDTGFIRLQIDGVTQSPGEISVIRARGSGSATEIGTHGFNWQSQALAPGSHTARVQWRTALGSNLCVDARSLIIFHK